LIEAIATLIMTVSLNWLTDHGHVKPFASDSTLIVILAQQAAKAALLNFYDTLRIEPIGERVSITIALPGFVVSELTTKGPPVRV
jgi:short-subunit dehydrogenase